MKMNSKHIFCISLLYSLVAVLANLIGVFMPNIFQSSSFKNPAFNQWVDFLLQYTVIDKMQYMSFLLPIVLSISYILFSGKKLKSHIINLPIVYATIGISGWIFYFLEEIVIILYAMNKGFQLNFAYIIKASFLNVLIESLVTFTLSFFITETIHIKFVLPKFFPEGHLYQYDRIKQPTIRFLFTVNYISVTLFPVVLLVSIILSISFYYKFPIDIKTYIVVVSALFIGLVITLALNRYFEVPLKKIKERILKIKEGDYKSKIKFVANDSFGDLCDILNEMTESIDEKTQKINEIQNSIIMGMATMVESRDNSTGGHIKRTSDCVRVFAEHLKKLPEYSYLSDSFYDSVIKAAPMHDLGKIAVDDAILRKPGKFTDEEYEIMKSHSAEGARIVENVLSSVDDQEFKQIAINVAHYHHEKWNGQGYPEKIKGADIPLEARIMALVDVFDALVSKRCYKDSFSYDKAFQIMEEDLGSHFDPQLGREFIKCRKELENLYSQYLPKKCSSRTCNFKSWSF